MTLPVPPGWPLELDPRTRWIDGRTLLSPSGRLLRLGPRGPAALTEALQGAASEPVRRLARRLLDAEACVPCPPPRPAGDVTVVIPVRDRIEQLRRCLGAVGDAGSVDVVVVDDGSHDPAAVERVCREAGARYVHRDNGGPAAARNTAVPLLHKDLVCFLDSDCVPPPGWLERLRGHLDDPAVVAVAPRVTGGTRSPLDLGTRPALVRPGGAVPYVPTACLLVRRTALGDQPFDERLRYGEDVDLVWRLLDAGGQIRYDPSVVVQHEEPALLRHRLVRRFRYGTSAAPLAQRHPHRLAHLVVTPLPALAVASLLARRPALGGLALALATQRLHTRLRGSRGTALVVAAQSVAGTALTLGSALAMAGPAAWWAAWRRPRLALLLAAPLLVERRDRGTPAGPLAYVAAGLLDHAAYGTGVVAGCVRARTARPLVPRVRRGR